MRILVIIEHNGAAPKPGSLAAIGFAREVAEHADGQIACLVIGQGVADVAAAATPFGTTYVADDEALAHPVADRYAKVIAKVAAEYQADMVTAASSTFAKDIVGRAAALLGGAMASDVVAHQWRDGKLAFERPIFADAVTATVALHGSPQIVTIRPTAYTPPEISGAPGEMIAVELGDPLPDGMNWENLESKESARPDVTDARVVVSGGRAFANSDDFERLVGGLADCLEGAAGSSRALVDAGITPNSLQVGQTGKVVAPELYMALGISGAVQHLAGMKNSKVVVAVNNDSDAPIFEVADYGLVGDVYEVVPELIEKLRAG